MENGAFAPEEQMLHFYTPGIYAEGYIVFVFPFVCLLENTFAMSKFGLSFFSDVYLSNH